MFKIHLGMFVNSSRFTDQSVRLLWTLPAQLIHACYVYVDDAKRKSSLHLNELIERMMSYETEDISEGKPIPIPGTGKAYLDSKSMNCVSSNMCLLYILLFWPIIPKLCPQPQTWKRLFDQNSILRSSFRMGNRVSAYSFVKERRNWKQKL